ncbi:MAG: hypothetical protein HY673_23845 [Chloroflexi bacterium]|nr:hypothetical protein [Chloroflexota bacterium]
MAKVLELEGRCRTTAMGIMPHTDIDRALQLVFGLDVPFWPQLPRISFYEDMYVQASQFFPGIRVDVGGEKVWFNTGDFEAGIVEYEQVLGDPQGLGLTEEYSRVYRRFLGEDLTRFYAVRGQMTGPVSFGFRVTDENSKPVIYNDSVKTILFDFMQRKVNIQYQQLRKKNPRAFVWLDEPGLGWVFSGFTGYDDVHAREDYRDFLNGVEGPKALHLCAAVNLPYLLSMGVEILSFDAYQIEVMPAGYAGAVGDYLREGKIIAWGIVPTDSTNLENETPETLAARLAGYWEKVTKGSGVEGRQIAEQALIAPARCCLKNVGKVGSVEENGASCNTTPAIGTIEETLVEKAFAYLPRISAILKDEYKIV